jgi:hypothetical protein
MYVDASYNIHADGKSHTGILLTMGERGGPIFCKSSKQKLVAQSSTEAELIALHQSLQYVSWANNLLNELGFKPTMRAVIHQDNKSTMVMAKKGSGNFGKTKHINMRYFSISEKIQTREVELSYLPTNLMIADILTKPIVGKMFKELRAKLMNN